MNTNAIQFQPLEGLLASPVQVLMCEYTAGVIDSPELAAIRMPPNSDSWILSRKIEYKISRFGLFQAIRRVDPSIDLPPDSLWPGPDRYPHWPETISGSISHKSGRVIVAVAPSKKVKAIGIDIETLMSEEQAERVAPRILTPDELLRVHPDHIPEMVSLIFSAKESLYKALYPQVRRYIDFHSAEIVGPLQFDKTQPIHFQFRLTKKWTDGLKKGQVFEGHALFKSGSWMTAIELR